jgi:hypothetical protein
MIRSAPVSDGPSGARSCPRRSPGRATCGSSSTPFTAPASARWSADPRATELHAEHFSPRELDGARRRDAPPREGAPAPVTADAGPAPEQPLSARWQRLQAERARLDELEKELLAAALSESDGVIAHAARPLDRSPGGGMFPSADNTSPRSGALVAHRTR